MIKQNELKKVLKIIAFSSLLLLSGCEAKVKQNLLLRNDGTGRSTISVYVDEVNSNYVDDYLMQNMNGILESKDKKIDGVKYKEYTLTKDFDNYVSMGYATSELKIEHLDNVDIYTINIDNTELVDTSEYDQELKDFKKYLDDNDIDYSFSITLPGHFLTNVKTISGNYTTIKKSIIPAATTYTWDIDNVDSIELRAELGPASVEMWVIFGSIMGVLGLVVSIWFFGRADIKIMIDKIKNKQQK